LRQIASLEKEVRERAKKETQKEATEAEAPMMNPGFNRLMLTNGSVSSSSTVSAFMLRLSPRSFVGQAPPQPPMMTGMGMNGNAMPPVRVLGSHLRYSRLSTLPR
jgi:clathrin heavy chain